MDPELLPLQRRLRLGWGLSAFVPVAVAAGFLAGPNLSRDVGITLLLLAALAEVVSPAVLYSVGFDARRERLTMAPRTLGRVAVALHVAALAVLAVSFVYFTRSTQDPSMAALGFLVGGLFIALLSLAPWLASVITGGVFATRSLQRAASSP